MRDPEIPLLEEKVNDFAIRSLRDIADRDYVHARLAYRSRLLPQFFWSALHCLEKYVKCIAVLNRIDISSVGHAVTPALDIVKARGKFSVWISDGTAELLGHLEGMAEYRYFQVSYYNLGHDVHLLDRAVWEVRRYCQLLDYSRLRYAEGLPTLEDELARITLARESIEKGTCIRGGWLERVIEKRQDPARGPLIWNNLFFGPSTRKRVTSRGFSEGANAPLFMHPEIVDEIMKYIRIEKHVAAIWRAEAEARESKDA